jgi:hypothetical protein
MAGERVGRIYEALVVAALDASAGRGQAIHWNVDVPQLMVKPDVIIGDPNCPLAIGLITRAGSRRDWHKKFWRNVGEAVDVKSVFPSARVVSINLGTEPKEDLVAALSAVVDIVVFPKRPTRELLERWVERLEPDAPKDAEELLAYVRRELSHATGPVKSAVMEIGTTSLSAMKLTTDRWASVTPYMTARAQHAADLGGKWQKPPSLRRGLSKLLVFGPPRDVLSQVDARGVPTDTLGTPMSTFGWATRSVAGWRITDEEIREAFAQFDRDTLAAVLESCSTEELRAMCADVASPAWLVETSKYLRTNKTVLSSPANLFHLLKRSRISLGVLNIEATVPPDLRGSWLYRAVSALLKSISGKKQGFGYEQLVADIRGMKSDPDAAALCKSTGATSEDLRKAGSTDSLRRKLVDWVSGLSGDVELADWQIAVVALALARRLSTASQAAHSKACDDFPAMIRRLTYEDRVATYAFFEPLPHLIKSALATAGCAHVVIERHSTLFSEHSDADRDVATCPVIQVKDTLIHWKSASELGRDHKTKELCGRGFALRHRVAAAGALVPFEEVAQLLLVLDGDFTASDVEHLVRAGWDHVVSSRDISSLPDLVSRGRANRNGGAGGR